MILGYAQVKNQARVVTWNSKNSREHARIRLGRIKIPYGRCHRASPARLTGFARLRLISMEQTIDLSGLQR